MTSLRVLLMLACLTQEPKNLYSPEPKHVAEIEIAANGGQGGCWQSISGSSDQGQGPSLRDSQATAKEHGQESEQEVHSTTFRLQLGGLLSQTGHTRQTSGIWSNYI